MTVSELTRKVNTDLLSQIDPKLPKQLVAKCVSEARDSMKMRALCTEVLAHERRLTPASANALLEDDDVMADLCSRGLEEFLGYLRFIGADDTGSYPPSAFIDFFWHMFLQFDAWYELYCILHCGGVRRFHLPSFEGEAKQPGARSSDETQLQLIFAGYPTTQAFWAKSTFAGLGECDDCKDAAIREDLCRDMPMGRLCQDGPMIGALRYDPHRIAMLQALIQR